MKVQLTLEEINAIPKNGIKVVSLFSGCGGSSLGYKLNGCEILAANEFDKYAQEVYVINHPNTILFKQDIRQLTGKKILKKIGLKKGQLDILDGSPPCAAYSFMGGRQKTWGREKNYSGTVQKVDDLFFEFARLLKELKPKVFIAENVKALASGQAKELLGSSQNKLFGDDSIIKTLEKCGYIVRAKVLNAAHYKVPQLRERLFIVGIRKDLNIVPTFPKRKSKTITTKMAIGDLIDQKADFKNSPKKTKYIKKYFRPGCTINEGLKIAKSNKLTGVLNYYIHRDRWNKPFQTLLQSGDRAFHPIKDRPITISEAKRLCSFPDDFILCHTPKENWERRGGAVPPNLMKYLSRHIIKLVFKKRKRR